MKHLLIGWRGREVKILSLWAKCIGQITIYDELRVYYAFNDIILAEKEQDRPHLGMSDILLDAIA